jgi:hypothetical protein
MTIEELEAEIAEDEAIEREMALVQAELDLQNESGPSKALRVGGNVLKGGAKGLDILRGPITAPIVALGLEALTGKDVYRGEEHLGSVDPTSLQMMPGVGEMLERAGVPEGGSISDVAPDWFSESGKGLLTFQKGGPLDFTTRGGGGVAADIAIDPATWLTGGLTGGIRAMSQGAVKGVGKAAGAGVRALPGGKAAFKGGEDFLKRMASDLPTSFTRGAVEAPIKALQGAGKLALRPLSGPAEFIGKRMYRKGLLKPAQVSERVGQDFAEAAAEKGIRGTAPQIERQATAVASKLKESRDALLDQADALGATVDLNKAFNPYLKELRKFVDDGRITSDEAAKLAEETVGTYFEKGDPSTALATVWKSDINKAIRKKARELSDDPNLYDELDKVAAKGIKEQIEKTVDEALPDAIGEFNKANKDLAPLLTARKTLERGTEKAEAHNVFGSIDAAYGAGGLASSVASEGGMNPLWAVGAIGGKKALDVAQSPWARTNVGLGLRRLGQNRLAPLADAGFREMLKFPAYPNELPLEESELIFQDEEGR